MPVLNINPAGNEVDTVVIKDASDSEILRVDTVNKRLVHTDTMWDDMRFAATHQRQGVTTKPDFDFTNIGLLFPQNDATEISYMLGQMPHTWKEESSIYPHVHYVQSVEARPTFKLDYRIYQVGGDIPAGFTTIVLDQAISLPWSGNDFHQIAHSSSPISMSGFTLSCMIDMKLYRDDNVVTGDVLVKEFDIHYEIDTLGSELEFIKA
jgi:hypothetical protein